MTRLLVLGLLLFCAPCRADWNYTSVDGAGGVPLNVVTAGQPDRPAILFIHGIGQSHYSFHKQLDSNLADEFFLVSFDLRGHGASGKPWVADAYTDPAAWAGDVAAVLAATRAKRPVIVAWSYGTLVAMDYVRQFGVATIAGLNLTGALGALRPFVMSTADDATTREFARIRKLQVSPSLLDQIAASRGMVRWLTAAPVPEAEEQVFQAISLMLPAYARRAMVSRPQDNRDLLDRLTLPVLLSLGAEDNAANLKDGAEMAADRSNVSLSVYQAAGHSVFYEQPARFNDELRRFARRAQQSTAAPEGK